MHARIMYGALNNNYKKKKNKNKKKGHNYKKRKNKKRGLYEQLINAKVKIDERDAMANLLADSELDRQIRTYAYTIINDSCMTLKNKESMFDLVDYIIKSYSFQRERQKLHLDVRGDTDTLQYGSREL